jgi:hypothetical protein
MYSKKRSIGRWALVAGTLQTLSNLFWILSISVLGAHQRCSTRHSLIKNIGLEWKGLTQTYLASLSVTNKLVFFCVNPFQSNICE